jgi:hypothetical protein
MYTIFSESGERILDIENGLMKLEDEFVNVRNNAIIPRKVLSVQQKFTVCAFMAAMKVRTISHRDHLSKQWNSVYERMVKMKKSVENASPEELRHMANSAHSDGPLLSMSDVKQLAEQPLQEMMCLQIQELTRAFMRKNLSFLCADTDLGFITSDNPCIWFDPERHKRPFPYNHIDPRFPSVEIIMPVSPQRLALLNSTENLMYIDLPEDMVDECNRMPRFWAKEYFIVNRNQTKEIWSEFRKS